MDLNIIKKKMTVGPKKGQTMYGLSRVSMPTIHSNAILDEVKQSSTFSQGDAKHIIKELANVMVEFVANGCAVDLGELGTLRPTITAKSVATRQECKASTITDRGIRYTSRADFAADMKGMSLRVLNSAEISAGSGSAGSGGDSANTGGGTDGTDTGSGSEGGNGGTTPSGGGTGGGDLEG